MALNEPTKKVCLLEDFVAEKDAFGPHQRVADAIADMVATETGGKAAAVIGTWGSGKSTVFNLLKKRLESEKGSASPLSETKLFLFDAWAHEVLTSGQQETLKRNLRDIIIDSDTCVTNLLQLFPRTVADCSILTEKADDLVRSCFPKMLERHDDVELTWLKTIISQCRELLKKCWPASKENFIERVRDLLKNGSNEKTNILMVSIAAELGIKADKKVD